MRNVDGFPGFGEVSKTTSFEDLRVSVKPKGVVLWRVKMKSELRSVREYCGCR